MGCAARMSRGSVFHNLEPNYWTVLGPQRDVFFNGMNGSPVGALTSPILINMNVNIHT